MIHFDFTLSDQEAWDLFDIIANEQAICFTQSQIGNNRPPLTRDWYRKRAAYLKELRKKMTNEHVKEHATWDWLCPCCQSRFNDKLMTVMLKEKHMKVCETRTVEEREFYRIHARWPNKKKVICKECNKRIPAAELPASLCQVCQASMVAGSR